MPSRSRSLPEPVASVLADQAAVISSAQLLELGLSRRSIETCRRNLLLHPLLPGGYADHVGEPTWLQRAWGAILYGARGTDLESVALCGTSAVRLHEGPGRTDAEVDDVHIAVDRARVVVPQPGVRVHRVSATSTRSSISRCDG